MATTSTSPPPPDSSKKRKRHYAPTEEIEVDVSLPEPPSKKAARRAKKGKTNPAPQASLHDISDLTEEAPPPSVPTPTSPPPPTAPPARSPHGIWIGNLSFLTTPSSLRTHLCTTASLRPSQITRVHLPLSTRPLLPHQIRQMITVASQDTDAPAAEPPKFQNKGFAYVDFDSAEGVFQALQATESVLDGRNVLIKDANNFSGRPEVVAAPAAGAGDATGKAGHGKEGKPKSKRVFVGNLAFDTTREELEGHFGQAGEVEDAFVATFEDTGKCKGFGWVRFGTEEEAERAVRGWVWKVEDDLAGDVEEEGEGEGGEGGDEEGKEGKGGKKLAPAKKRKWWINKLRGRLLRCEYAEDASTRYKKRFGKGRRAEDGVGAGAGAVEATEGGEEGGQMHEKRRRHRVRGTDEQKAEARSRRPRDARTIAPGQALANAPRQSGAIVQGQGKKVTFD
ncbi:hypothetical protein KVT40_008958 [Elsinoe batatas]|uniref:RRM domain-containing protein n=1 Tax=Elsinoe batatas TaxID=2601811 RepID=A0A8K0KUX8_9PEZI|nr:hypothetical protein KVT40_008958 [Elsinoe batatas]